MQSTDYVPGVSGWKMHKDGRLEIAGVVRVLVSSAADEKPDAPTESDLNAFGLTKADFAKPFIVVEGVTYISEAEVKNSAIKQKISENWSLKMELRDGKCYAAGIGLGIDSQFLVSADRFAINDRDAGQILEDLASQISKTELGSYLFQQCEKIKSVAETVRNVLREELKPGGILHRK